MARPPYRVHHGNKNGIKVQGREGAALEVASPVGIPAEFNLLISGNIAKRPCRVVWVRDKRIGVAFRSA
jgi:hypothetical protein